LGLSSSAPDGGRGSGLISVGRSRRGVRTKKNLQKSVERFSRKIDLSLFPLGARVGDKKRNGHRYSSVIKVLNTRRDRTRGNVVPGNGAVEGGETAAIWGAKYRKMEHLDNYFRFD